MEKMFHSKSHLGRCQPSILLSPQKIHGINYNRATSNTQGVLPHKTCPYRSPLIMACEHGNLTVCDFLVKKGANVLLTDDHGHNATWYATSGGYG